MVAGTSTRFLLRWIDTAGRTGEFELRQGVTTLGRAITSDVVLADHRASREHARIHVRGEQVLLEDLNSRNGTFVNGARVSTVALGPDSRIGIGDLQFVR